MSAPLCLIRRGFGPSYSKCGLSTSHRPGEYQVLIKCPSKWPPSLPSFCSLLVRFTPRSVRPHGLTCQTRSHDGSGTGRQERTARCHRLRHLVREAVCAPGTSSLRRKGSCSHRSLLSMRPQIPSPLQNAVQRQVCRYEKRQGKLWRVRQGGKSISSVVIARSRMDADANAVPRMPQLFVRLSADWRYGWMLCKHVLAYTPGF